MPLYEYECEACGQRFELIRKFSDPPLDVCTLCGKGPVTRLLSSPAIQFKGSGFYITDYVKKGGTDKADGAKGDGSKTAATSDAKSEGATTDTGGKSDTKSDAPAASGSSSTSPAKSSGPAKD
jgi:putative FmdB family regulatory protein